MPDRHGPGCHFPIRDLEFGCAGFELAIADELNSSIGHEFPDFACCQPSEFNLTLG
jgi:hypothetical protein